jgi:ubiquinone/menaquinone biosynthesis C-methylase UbiE
VLPVVGGLLSGQPRAYRYLSSTVDSYLAPQELVGLARKAGWKDPKIRLLTLGTVGMLSGRTAI